MSHSRGGLSLGVLPSSLAWGSSDQSPQRQTVHIGGLVEGRSGGLLSGETLTQSDSATYDDDDDDNDDDDDEEEEEEERC